jgi:hypothetical protein
MINMKKIITGVTLFAAPMLTFAQGANAFSILDTLRSLVDRLIPFFIAAGLAYFIFGIVKYVIAGDSDDKEKARHVIVQGLIGLFIMLSVWGIIGVFQRTFQVGNTEINGSNIPAVNNY